LTCAKDAAFIAQDAVDAKSVPVGRRGALSTAMHKTRRVAARVHVRSMKIGGTVFRPRASFV
jgi:hypothetical protein